MLNIFGKHFNTKRLLAVVEKLEALIIVIDYKIF